MGRNYAVLGLWLGAALLAGLPSAAAAAELSTEETVELERLLYRLNFDPGEVDGVVDERTRAAIRRYQEFAAITPDGEPSPALLAEVRGIAQAIEDMKQGQAAEQAAQQAAWAAEEEARAAERAAQEAAEQAAREAEEEKSRAAAELAAQKAAEQAARAAEEEKARAAAEQAAQEAAEQAAREAARVAEEEKARAAAEQAAQKAVEQAARVAEEEKARAAEQVTLAAAVPEPEPSNAPLALLPTPTPTPTPALAPSPAPAPTSVASTAPAPTPTPTGAAVIASSGPAPSAPPSAKTPLKFNLEGVISRLVTTATAPEKDISGPANPMSFTAGRSGKTPPGLVGKSPPGLAGKAARGRTGTQLTKKFPPNTLADSKGYKNFKQGYAAAQDGKLMEAIDFYTSAIGTGDLKLEHLAGAYYNRANAHHYNGTLDIAIQDYTASILNKSDFAGAYYNRGFAFEANGQHTRALADFMKARALGLQRLGVRSPDLPPPRP